MNYFLACLAALFLARGTAHANEDWLDRCGKHLIHTYGHHGYMFFLMPKGASRILDDGRKRQLPGRLFRIDDDDNLYFRGRSSGQRNGDKRAALLQREHIVRLMSDRAAQPESANGLRKALRALMQHAVTMKIRADDPTQGVKRIKNQEQRRISYLDRSRD